MVFNKLDRFTNGEGLARFHERFPTAVFVSARCGQGIAELMAELGAQLRPVREFLELRIPHEKASMIARLHEVGQIVERDYAGEQARFKARIPPHYRFEFEPYIQRDLTVA
jgi:GTP-binding protein HflX